MIMDIQPPFEEIFRLSLPEMNWVMDRLGSPSLVGIKSEDLIKQLPSGTDERQLIESLRQKGILLRKGKQNFSWDNQARIFLDALLFPEKALIVFRDRRGEGRRFFRVLRKGETIVLHSFPNDQENIIGLFRKPEEILQLLVSWFPFHQLPYSAMRFQMEKELFENFKSLIVKQKRDEALKAFDPAGIDTTQKRIFLRCLWNATLSGSIARISIQNGLIREGDSISFLTDGHTGWLITQASPPNSKQIRVIFRRTGLDFAASIRDQIEEFTGRKLPRQEIDSAHGTVRFILSQDELAKALAAINCHELSLKIFAEASQDQTGGPYDEHMKNAQQSLTDAGLCTLSDTGMTVLADDLAHAVLPIGAADAMVQIVKSGGGHLEDLGVYIIRGGLFTTYLNYGEKLQILISGKYKDVGSYIQSLFPDFGTESREKQIEAPVSYDILEKVMHKAKDLQEAKTLLVSDGMAFSVAKDFAEDASEALFHATLTRKNMPDRKGGEAVKNDKSPLALFLLKSPRRSWLFQFHESNPKGTATLSDQSGLLKALRELIS
jgi:hypothetical protein